MRSVIIMRGIPGSGKTTFLRTRFSDYTVVSADHYRMKEGKYVFKPEDTPYCHNCCLMEFLSLLKEKHDKVAVDNTNTRVFEIAPYYRLAEAFGYDVRIVYLPCCPLQAAKRNVHDVPPETVMAMSLQMEALPTHWKQITQIIVSN